MLECRRCGGSDLIEVGGGGYWQCQRAQCLAMHAGRPVRRPNPFSNVPFNPAAGTVPAMSAQRYSVAIYSRYKLLSNGLHARYVRLVVAAARSEGSTLPEVGAMHYAHNWHRCGCRWSGQDCPVVKVMDRYNRLSTWLFLRERSEQHGADHRAHIEDGEAGRYLWCDGCVNGPSRCEPTSGPYETRVANEFFRTRRARMFAGGR